MAGGVEEFTPLDRQLDGGGPQGGWRAKPDHRRHRTRDAARVGRRRRTSLLFRLPRRAGAWRDPPSAANGHAQVPLPTGRHVVGRRNRDRSVP
jgi:hypothetical protein